MHLLQTRVSLGPLVFLSVDLTQPLSVPLVGNLPFEFVEVLCWAFHYFYIIIGDDRIGSIASRRQVSLIAICIWLIWV